MIDYILLFPYYLGLKLRHHIYNKGIKKVHSTPVKSIGLGNISVGGTGKTPHTEMIIRTLIRNNKKVAVISRGYKRKSKGFQILPVSPSASLYGDEPCQIKNKFPRTTVAVDKNRVRASSQVQGDVIVFDDIFQYRAIKPDVSIVLVDYNRPSCNDMLMPLGRLRDLRERIHAADIIILTKCPYELSGFEMQNWACLLGLNKYDVSECYDKEQNKYLFFTSVGYEEAQPVFEEGDQRYLYSKKAIVFTGIANDSGFCNYIRNGYSIKGHLIFGDHHKFTSSDIKSIARLSEANPTSVVLTTEKDSQRIKECSTVPDSLKKRMFYVPICVDFLDDRQKKLFKTLICDEKCK